MTSVPIVTCRLLRSRPPAASLAGSGLRALTAAGPCTAFTRRRRADVGRASGREVALCEGRKSSVAGSARSRFDGATHARRTAEHALAISRAYHKGGRRETYLEARVAGPAATRLPSSTASSPCRSTLRALLCPVTDCTQAVSTAPDYEGSRGRTLMADEALPLP